MRIRIGTRGSRLARSQTTGVADGLRALGHHVDVSVIVTMGDRDQSSPFESIGAPGVFVREIEAALLRGEIDLAVHSYKDLPSVQPEGLKVLAVPERLDPADLVLVRPDAHQSTAPDIPVRTGARIGTSAARRRALVRSRRPDLSPVALRGNIDTRIDKLVRGDYDAIVLAAAGLERLERDPVGAPDGLRELVRQSLDPDWFVPAPTQGALAVQGRTGDAAIAAAVAHLHRDELERALTCERRLLSRVEGSCSLPFGAWCRDHGEGDLDLVCVLGTEQQLETQRLHGDDPLELADRAWAGFARRGSSVS